MRVFVKLRKTLSTHEELARKLGELEKHLYDHDEQIQAIFDAIQKLISPKESSRKKIGFEVLETPARYGLKQGR